MPLISFTQVTKTVTFNVFAGIVNEEFDNVVINGSWNGWADGVLLYLMMTEMVGIQDSLQSILIQVLNMYLL